MNIIETNLQWAHALTPLQRVDYIVLHHEAGQGTVEAVHNYHLSLGWAGIAYHFYVRRDGSIYRGRPLDMQGGHTKGYNNCSIGICAEGNFQEEIMSDAQKEALHGLVLELRAMYPQAKIVKHSDLCATACPGKNYPFDYIVSVADNEWEREKAEATQWVQDMGISDGTRPYDAIQRVEMWVMLRRLCEQTGG